MIKWWNEWLLLTQCGRIFMITIINFNDSRIIHYTINIYFAARCGYNFCYYFEAVLRVAYSDLVRSPSPCTECIALKSGSKLCLNQGSLRTSGTLGRSAKDQVKSLWMILLQGVDTWGREVQGKARRRCSSRICLLPRVSSKGIFPTTKI